jgi:hypothetical protein
MSRSLTEEARMGTQITLEICSSSDKVLFSPMFLMSEVAELNGMTEEEVIDRLKSGEFSPHGILGFLGSSRTWSEYLSYARDRKPEMPDPDNFGIKLKIREEFDLN